MPKITIDLDVNTHQVLKELAKKDRRSLTNYINILLEDHANDHANSEEKNISTITSKVKKQVIDYEEGEEKKKGEFNNQW